MCRASPERRFPKAVVCISREQPHFSENRRAQKKAYSRGPGRPVAIAAVPQAAAAQEKSIVVFAAASMKNALDDIDDGFTKNTGIKVVASYAASSALMKQIEQGAPADVFLSADIDGWITAKNNLIKIDTRFDLLGNRLVLIAPKDSKIGDVTIAPGFDLAKLAGDGRIATGDVRAVPSDLRQGRAGKARRLGVRRAENGDGRRMSAPR